MPHKTRTWNQNISAAFKLICEKPIRFISGRVGVSGTHVIVRVLTLESLGEGRALRMKGVEP